MDGHGIYKRRDQIQGFAETVNKDMSHMCAGCSTKNCTQFLRNALCLSKGGRLQEYANILAMWVTVSDRPAKSSEETLPLSSKLVTLRSDTQSPWLAHAMQPIQGHHILLWAGLPYSPTRHKTMCEAFSIMQCQVIGDSANWHHVLQEIQFAITCFMYVCLLYVCMSLVCMHVCLLYACIYVLVKQTQVPPTHVNGTVVRLW